MNEHHCGLAGQYRATVLSQRQLAERTYCLRIGCPDLAARIVPGQFFMVRPHGGTDPLLGRPFALYDVVWESDPEGRDRPVAVEFVYHTVGKLTDLMSRWSGGEQLDLWGPLGNGFPVPSWDHLLCIGGGIGYTPFLAVAREAADQRRYGSPARSLQRVVQRITFCYGVQTKHLRADLSDFSEIPGLEILVATDDGSEGHHGFVTDLLSGLLAGDGNEVGRPGAVYCCGPEQMMHAAARICAGHSVPCWLSLETPMACGFGACFSCVTAVRTEGGGWDYRRTCVEGPIFPADSLAF